MSDHWQFASRFMPPLNKTSPMVSDFGSPLVSDDIWDITTENEAERRKLTFELKALNGTTKSSANAGDNWMKDFHGLWATPNTFARDGKNQLLMPNTASSSRSSSRTEFSMTGLETASDYSAIITPFGSAVIPVEESCAPSSIHLGSPLPLQDDPKMPHCLINTISLQLTEFGKDDPIPLYAILSHRWGKQEEEVGYQELKRPTAETFRKAGYYKIALACNQALLQHGLQYLWVDTCCINQHDKDDIHRNIKSMFAYYQHSYICFAYLVDISGHDFLRSVWFTRGWTLQELLAPLDVIFFDCNWQAIGRRNQRSWEISIITGIPEDVIKGETRIYEVDVEEKMSWSAHRETSRPPDQAYCLFGILGVSVEPNYDEDAETAFSRLCEAWFRKISEESGGRKIMVPNLGRLYGSLRSRARKGREAWSYRGRNDEGRIMTRKEDVVGTSSTRLKPYIPHLDGVMQRLPY
ncbi:hypothetical protein D9758_010230 [Tetrapyrgos nigripes]|uniref:Heterokaryon incompatibility domain-containing protein n=1 Tax=Tetrapyrgos nigripes TaxID=182062 RepID=A0A8H5CZ68_9AGAR|nr:hypothetical protein D9758_010230 [Tetrapyrgos nigripes]